MTLMPTATCATTLLGPNVPVCAAPSLSSFLDCLSASVRADLTSASGEPARQPCDYHSDWIFPSQTTLGSLLTDTQPQLPFCILGSALC